MALLATRPFVIVGLRVRSMAPISGLSRFLPHNTVGMGCDHGHEKFLPGTRAWGRSPMTDG